MGGYFSTPATAPSPLDQLQKANEDGVKVVGLIGDNRAKSTQLVVSALSGLKFHDMSTKKLDSISQLDGERPNYNANDVVLVDTGSWASSSIQSAISLMSNEDWKTKPKMFILEGQLDDGCREQFDQHSPLDVRFIFT